MNKDLIVIVAVVLGLILLGGAVFAVSKFGSQVQNSLQTQLPTASPSAAQQKNVIAQNPVLLNITSPTDKIVVNTPTIKISGTTLPGAEVAINEQDIKADANGAFSTSLTLDEGENPIVIDAFDADGNSNSVELTTTYEP